MQENLDPKPGLPSEAQFEAWLQGLPHLVADVVREHSPFHPHRLRSTGQTVYISRFEGGDAEDPDVKLSVVAPRAANPGQTDDLSLEGVDPDELYSLAS